MHLFSSCFAFNLTSILALDKPENRQLNSVISRDIKSTHAAMLSPEMKSSTVTIAQISEKRIEVNNLNVLLNDKFDLIALSSDEPTSNIEVSVLRE